MVFTHLEGNSGCSIYRVNDTVEKVSKDTDYNNRLYLSYLKMNDQRRDIFKVPLGLSYRDDVPLHVLCADYIRGFPMALSIENMTIGEAKDFAFKVLDFVFDNMDGGQCIVDTQTLNIKIKSCQSTMLLSDEFSYNIPSGYCHGDFTLSNMIDSGSDIYLIDHLDSYIESPLMDLVKLYQDLDFYWSLRYIDQKYITNNFYVNMNVIRNNIDHCLVSNSYTRVMDYLKYVNYVRILPYLQGGDWCRVYEFCNGCYGSHII